MCSILSYFCRYPRSLITIHIYPLSRPVYALPKVGRLAVPSSRDRRPNPDYRLQRRAFSYHGTLLVAKFSCRPPWFSTLIRKLVRVPQVFPTRVQELVLTREMRVPSGYWVTGSLGVLVQKDACPTISPGQPTVFSGKQ